MDHCRYFLQLLCDAWHADSLSEEVPVLVDCLTGVLLARETLALNLLWKPEVLMDEASLLLEVIIFARYFGKKSKLCHDCHIIIVVFTS